jgi:hypothetical protein
MKTTIERLWVSFLDSSQFRQFAKQGRGAALFQSNAYQSLNLTRLDLLTRYQSFRSPTLFREIKTYCVFIGHMKSGGSMLGSLLDAHPNAILADEVDALRYVQAGLKRDQVFHLLLKISRREFMKGRVTARRLTAYSWLVPGQWQGRYATLQVIGDSTTGASTQRLSSDPGLLERLDRVLEGVEAKFIHVIRNPFDPISVMMVRGRRTFENALEHYFTNCEMLAGLRQRISPERLVSVRYEDFISNPKIRLAEICSFLGMSANQDYLQACSDILQRTPERSRQMVEWKPEWIEAVRARITGYDFLDGYSFDI